MIATHVNIHDKEVKSNMPYFGVFNRMFVHFHLYTTHEAVYDSLRDLNFWNHCFTTYCNVWPRYTTIFSSILKLIYLLIYILLSFSSLHWTPPPLHHIGILNN